MIITEKQKHAVARYLVERDMRLEGRELTEEELDVMSNTTPYPEDSNDIVTVINQNVVVSDMVLREFPDDLP